VIGDRHVGEMDSLTEWSYGKGREGRVDRKQDDVRGKTVVIGQFFPWWGLVAGRLGLTLTNVVVESPVFETLVRKYFVGVPVRVTKMEELSWKELLVGVRVAALGRWPGSSVDLLWGASTVEVVLISGNASYEAPKRWSKKYIRVDHQMVGG
jgi:hypothetical protein